MGGVIELHKYMPEMKGHVAAKKEEFTKAAHEELKAYAFLACAHENKCGSLLKSLAQQQSLKNTQYPKTLTTAAEVLMEHKWDPKYNENKRKKNQQSKKDKDDYQQEKKKEAEPELSFAQLDNACHCCGKKGHGSDKCYQRNKMPKEDWFINKLQRKTEAEWKQQQHAHVETSDAASVMPTVTTTASTSTGPST